MPEDVKQDNPALTEHEDKGEDAKSEGLYMQPLGSKRSEFDAPSAGEERAKGSTNHYNKYHAFQPGGDDAKGSTGHYNHAPQFSGLMDSNFTASSQVSATATESGHHDAPQGDEAKGSTGHYNVAPHFSNLMDSGSEDAKSNGQLTISSPISATVTPTESSPLGQAPVPRGQVVGNKTQVKYLGTDEAREEFELKVGGSVTQGGQPYDTSAMYSKFKGDGFAIYGWARTAVSTRRRTRSASFTIPASLGVVPWRGLAK